MSEPLVYVIKGDPIALARARFSHRSVYDSQKQQKIVLGIGLRNQHDDREMFSGPLLLDITFYMEIPKTKLKLKSALWGKYHSFRPDLSNLIKFVEDLATDIIYDDDCLISKINAKKIYGDPRTEFTITKLI